MKSILILLSIFMLNYAHSQVKIEKGIYQFSESEQETYSPQFKTEAGERIRVAVQSGHKIEVVSYSGDTVFYRYLPFDSLYNEYNGLDKLFKKNPNEKTSAYASVLNDPLFFMTSANFSAYTDPVYKRYKGATAGIYTIPFRLRDIGGDNFDFEPSLSLQANLIFGFGTKRVSTSWFDLSCGIGLTSISIDQTNSNLADTVNSRTASGLTISFGAVFKPSPRTSIGFFLGTDFLGAKDRETEWIYHGKTWVGLGINIALSPIETDKPRLTNESQTRSQM